MSPSPYKVLILCTGNSARSIIAEYLLRQKGRGRFETYSAGSHPTGTVHPLARWVLKEHYGIDASGARSKSWGEFKEIKFDFVITVCDHAREACPVFPGGPVSAHFGSPDPAGYEGTEDQKKWLFVQVASQISRRLDLFCALPDAKLEPGRVQAIGAQFPLANKIPAGDHPWKALEPASLGHDRLPIQPSGQEGQFIAGDLPLLNPIE